jgi:predicted MFS family arabinose efflux permease
MVRQKRLRFAGQLGITQTVGYASSYYLPAVLANPIAEEFGISYQSVFLFAAAASIVAGLLGPLTGSLIDRFGGRLILPLGSIAFGLGLLLMASSTGILTFLLAWLVIGVGAAMGLYDAAFATVVEVFGDGARRIIAGITLIAGFASTIGWPITSALSQAGTWRDALVFWAVINLLVCLPLHVFLPGLNGQSRLERTKARVAHQNTQQQTRLPRFAVFLTSLLFLLGGFVQVVMGYHLPGLLAEVTLQSSLALLAAALLGPGQVLARLLQVLMPNFFSTKLVATLALVLHPIASVFLLVFGADAIFVFAFIHGMGSGFLTVAAGTLPLYLFGSKDYGKRQGYIMAASDLLLGFAPFAFGLLLVTYGAGSLMISSASSLLAFGILLWLLRIKRAIEHQLD